MGDRNVSFVKINKYNSKYFTTKDGQTYELDDEYEYRHVLLPKAVYRNAPRGRLLYEEEWRHLGVQQSRGWVHYEVHKPEPFILLFRRPLGTDPTTGKVPDNHPLAAIHNGMLKNPNIIRQ